MISLIVAFDDKQGIGAHNHLLWHIKKDLARFQKITIGHPVIMGRKTYQSIGRPLPQRTNIIITRDPDFSAPGCLTAISLESAIALAKDIDNQEVFIIGGGQIYREALAKNLVDKLYVTKVQGDFQADTFFPDYSHFKLLKQSKGQEGPYRFTFYVFENN